jgi:hypothetical protein
MNDGLKKALWGDFSIKRLLRSMIIVPLFSYLIFAAYAYFLSDRLIFQPPPSSYADDQKIVKLISKDGVEISAIYLQNPNAEHVILYSHGNAEDIGDGLSDAVAMQRIGFSVFAYDYHGYGTSRGKPNEQNAYDDADAAYDYLTLKLGVPPDRIIALGRSLGGAAAIDLAARRPLAGLIVESSFITAFRVLTRIPLLPFDKFRNIDKIKKVKCPALIIHGRADEIIPFHHGMKLYEAANEPKSFFWADGAGHNDLRLIAGKNYWNALREFALFIKRSRPS